MATVFRTKPMFESLHFRVYYYRGEPNHPGAPIHCHELQALHQLLFLYLQCSSNKKLPNKNKIKQYKLTKNLFVYSS
jgi:hypothetical protein